MILRDLADHPDPKAREAADKRKIINTHDGSVTYVARADTLHAVSTGLVVPHPRDHARCHLHGAMNSMWADGTLWRCLAEGCGLAAYREGGRA